MNKISIYTAHELARAVVSTGKQGKHHIADEISKIMCDLGWEIIIPTKDYELRKIEQICMGCGHSHKGGC